MTQQTAVFAILAGALILFVWGRIRYDLVALLALLTVAFGGLVAQDEVFAGFGHPAVITVAAVLIISRALANAGVVDYFMAAMEWTEKYRSLQIAVLCLAVATLSGFINNVGSLALFMPLALRMAKDAGQPPSLLLMPIAFASLLGGLTTLIGTPPNIIIATFRAEATGTPFGLFDFAPVGVLVALAGVAFIALIGWRLLPKREGKATVADLFKVEDYVTELLVPDASKAIGKTFMELINDADVDLVVLGLLRGQQQLPAMAGFGPLQAGDILIVETDAEHLKKFIESSGLEPAGSFEEGQRFLDARSVTLQEGVVMPDSLMVGRSAWALDLRSSFGVNLLAVSRQGQRLRGRLKDIRFQPGDVVLLQGTRDALLPRMRELGCLLLATEPSKLGQPRRTLTACGLFLAAILCTFFGVAPAHVTFIACAVLMVMSGMIGLREAYASINWPVIVLLGAMIPVGLALERSGGAQTLADLVIALGQGHSAELMLALVFVCAMILSDAINNAAVAVLMAPIAIAVASGLGVSIDPFLMAVAVGASSAFLTPIGHQSNTLVMGPGGYRFSDYWKMGLPLSFVYAGVAIPLILHFWPLRS